MRRVRLVVVMLAASLPALAVPAAAPAQTPGDEQYVDPFGSGQEEQATPEPAEPEPEPEAAPEPAAPEPTQPPPAAAAQETPEPQQQLPYTGADEGLVALAGALLLASGLALRRRWS